MNATFRPIHVQNSIQNARADEYRKKYPWILVSDWKFYWGFFFFFPPICLLVEFLGFMFIVRGLRVMDLRRGCRWDRHLGLIYEAGSWEIISYQEEPYDGLSF